MIVLRDFFIFSSSPVDIINPIPHHVITITANTPVIRIKNWIIEAIASDGVLLISGSCSVGGTTDVLISRAETHVTNKAYANTRKITDGRSDFFIK